MVRRRITFAIVLFLLATTLGCANVKANKTPNADFSQAHSFYVVQQGDSELHTPIVDDLHERGLQATSGPRSSVPSGTDILVTFTYNWHWDMTMYLLDYDIQFRRPGDEQLLASAKSYRPSLQRAEPKIMAHEAIDAIFNAK